MTTETQAEKETFTVNGRVYAADGLPQEVKSLIVCYQKWEIDLDKQRADVFKTEAAMRAVAAEITSRLKFIETTNAAIEAGIAPAPAAQ